MALKDAHTANMRSRIDELLPLAEQNDGLVTATHARKLGITDSVLSRLTQRGKLERVARGVYRIPYFPADRLSQNREAVLWARASQGPEQVALSHETALSVYGISDVNPGHVHLTVPKNARLRRQKPKWIVIHRGELPPSDVTTHGQPTQNARVESFHGKLREECLRVSWFQNLFEARRQIAAWRKDYNEERPHSSLGYLTPHEYAARESNPSCGKDAGQNRASLENAKGRVSHFPTAPAAGILQIHINHQDRLRRQWQSEASLLARSSFDFRSC